MNKRVLVIDDDLAVGKSCTLALEDIGCQVDTVESGEAGIDKASNTEYDLIFLDLKMPGINGIETLIGLRDNGHKIPIYIITAFQEEFTNQLRVVANDGYECEIIQKPIESQDLVNITKAILESVGAR